MPAPNVIGQLGPVPVQTPVQEKNGNFTRGWIQWFQYVFQAIKTIPAPSSAVPANPSVVVGYQVSVNQAGQTIYIPYYQ